MRKCTIRTRLAALWVTIAVAAAVPALATTTASAQEAYVPISGSGSTWASNALDQWRRNLATSSGITVSYTANGSTSGRSDFRSGTTDFAVSDLEYGLGENGQTDPPPVNRDFAYMPFVAGGTAFMYNLKIGNTRVTNLRLSGENIARIFTRQITDWSDPALQADNPGLVLPSRPIAPVVRSDGAGTTAQFTRWMADRYSTIWDAYCGRPNCGFTSNYPVAAGVEAKAGSQGVAGFVAQDSSEGAITYVENSYARNSGFPVAKVLNDGGYYVPPTAGNVAVALTSAVVRPDLTADLSGVYRSADPRAYPLSGYSLMIIPTDLRANFTTQKGRTLSEFAYYAVCEGQQQADALGYSPLPGNLVRAGLDQVARIPGTTGRFTSADLSGCRNPNIGPDGSDVLSGPAPQPCDHTGPTQCGRPGSTTTPTPTPIQTGTPVPTAAPTPTVTPTPTAAPGPTATPAPHLGYADRVKRAVAELLARIFGVDPHRDLAPADQLRAVLNDIRHLGRRHPAPGRQ